MEKRERGRSLVSLLVFGAVAVCACVAIGQLGGRHQEGRTSELVEVGTHHSLSLFYWQTWHVRANGRQEMFIAVSDVGGECPPPRRSTA